MTTRKKADLPRIKVLRQLFAVFPERNEDVDQDESIDGYLLGLTGIPDGFVSMAVQRYTSNQVEGQSEIYPPTAPQLAGEARRLWNEAIEADGRRARALKYSPPPADRQISPEERERGLAVLSALLEQLGGPTRDKKKPETVAGSFKRVNAALALDMSDEAISKRLHIGTAMVRADPE